MAEGKRSPVSAKICGQVDAFSHGRKKQIMRATHQGRKFDVQI